MQRLVRRARTAAKLWRFVPLGLALFFVERRTRAAPPPQPSPQVSDETPGLSVIVPERGTPEFLAETLEALAAALARVEEPAQVIVVVNGANEADYAALRMHHPTFEWQFHRGALGYNGAIHAGLVQAKHTWTYLLNSDMRLEPDALRAVLTQRRPWVFAIASQIFFSDPTRRREETGWSDFHVNPLVPEVYERDPGPDARLVRGSLYAGGGSALFRTGALRDYVRDSVDYSPFYWEDADWGVRAWSDGWEVLFCPASRAWHHHRGTVKRYYDEAEVARVIRRNALLFDLRHDWTGRTWLTQLRDISLLDAASRRELGGIGLARRVARVRTSTRRARQRGLRFDLLAVDRWYGERAATTAVPRKPRVLLASPFALFPPAHGGARRVAELVQRLAHDVDFILLGDERSLYGDNAEAWFTPLLAAHLVEGRGDVVGEAPQPLEIRMARCAWRGMREELARLIERYQPDIVQVEFMELARLAEEKQAAQRWILALHDVYLSGKPQDADSDAMQRAALARFDALTACSAEDAALLPPQLPATLIGNGAIDRRAAYTPSPDAPPRLLFMGPFRYAPNLHGVLEFLDSAWPALRARHPDLVLTILGGEESAAIAAREPRLRQPGVELVSRFVDPAPYLAARTLSINPQREIRGSSIKLIESLLAGRVCVSTADGARGFAEAKLAGLVIADGIAAMATPILALLDDPATRHARERADDAALDAFTWDAMAARQLVLYRQLLAVPSAAESQHRTP